MASKHFGVSLKQLRELMEFRKSEGIHKLNEIGGLQGLLDALNTSEELGIHRDINFRKKCAILLKPTMEININYYFLHRYLWRQIWPPNQKRRVRIQHNSSKAIQDIPSIGMGGLARSYTYYFGNSCYCLFRYVLGHQKNTSFGVIHITEFTYYVSTFLDTFLISPFLLLYLSTFWEIIDPLPIKLLSAYLHICERSLLYK